MPPRLSLGIALLVGPALLACASAPQLQSTRPDPPIAIDGAYDDWAGRFAQVGDGRSVGLAVANDRDDLYLCLATRDLVVGRMLERGGFTLWLDPAGGERRALGLRVGAARIGPGKASTPPVEVVFDGAQYGYQLTELTPEGAVDVRAAQHADVVVYEMRLALGRPLVPRGADPAQVTLRATPSLGVGIRAEMPPDPADAQRGDGASPPRRGRDAVDPLRIWVRVGLDGSR